MALDSAAVEKIAHLARLGIEAAICPSMPATCPTFSPSSNSSMRWTAGVCPDGAPLDARQRLREDTVTEPNQREAFQAMPPSVEAGLYLVPKVIE
jgi:aspartyl-tRNA(Asn)/glutamyl-tRNA(Gln) amidotransferase subunit C